MKAQLISPQFLFNLHEHQKSQPPRSRVVARSIRKGEPPHSLNGNPWFFPFGDNLLSWQKVDVP